MYTTLENRERPESGILKFSKENTIFNDHYVGFKNKGYLQNNLCSKIALEKNLKQTKQTDNLNARFKQTH